MEVDVPDPTTPAAERACRALLDALPDRVNDLTAAEFEPSDALGAAWGDPAIVLTCGGPMSETFTNVSPCDAIDGVDWYVDEATRGDQGADVEMFTVGRDPVVHVTIPADYRPEGYLATTADLAPAVKAHLPRVGKPCV